MDQTSDRVTQSFVNSLPWPHGRKDLRHRITKVNKMPFFVESWYPSSNDEYAILLDETTELSEMFYEWAKYTVLRYRYSPSTTPQSKSILGVSLYAPRLIDSYPDERRLFDPAPLLQTHGYAPHSPYLMQAGVSTGVGALYFPEHWREFHDYITARVTDMNKKKMQNVTVPNSRSSQWTHSWRRYFDEFLYMRAYTVLYPNFEGHTSFATHHLDLKVPPQDSYAQAVSLFQVPLMRADVMRDRLPGHRLPEYRQLPILDMWGNVERQDTLVERGHALQRQVSACNPLRLGEHMHDPSDMLCPFAKLIPVAVPSQAAPVPEFSTRVVAIYAASEQAAGVTPAADATLTPL